MRNLVQRWWSTVWREDMFVSDRSVRAVVRLDSIGPSGERVETRVYLDVLYAVLTAKAMQHRYATWEDIYAHR